MQCSNVVQHCKCHFDNSDGMCWQWWWRSFASCWRVCVKQHAIQQRHNTYQLCRLQSNNQLRRLIHFLLVTCITWPTKNIYMQIVKQVEKLWLWRICANLQLKSSCIYHLVNNDNFHCSMLLRNTILAFSWYLQLKSEVPWILQPPTQNYSSDCWGSADNGAGNDEV